MKEFEKLSEANKTNESAAPEESAQNGASETTPIEADAPETNDSSEDQLEELQLKFSAKEKDYLYLYSEFENFKKRVARERSDAVKFASEGLARDLLLSIDNMERALQFTNPEGHASLVEGLNMVLKQLLESFAQHGIRPVDAAEGVAFDPNLHEAISQESSDEVESGKIIREEMKGYRYHDRLLRPSKVVVSSGVKN